MAHLQHHRLGRETSGGAGLIGYLASLIGLIGKMHPLTLSTPANIIRFTPIKLINPIKPIKSKLMGV